MTELAERPKRAMIAQPLSAVNVPGILLTRRTVELAVGLTISTINRRISKRLVPEPVGHPKPSRWRSDDIQAVIAGTWTPT